MAAAIMPMRTGIWWTANQSQTSLNNGSVDTRLESQSLRHSIAKTQVLSAHRCTRPSNL